MWEVVPYSRHPRWPWMVGLSNGFCQGICTESAGLSESGDVVIRETRLAYFPAEENRDSQY